MKKLECAKGEKLLTTINIEGSKYEIPLTIINGKKEGKTILITSGVHGSEYDAIQTTIEMANEITPDEVSGKIIFIHLVNASAFYNLLPFVTAEDNKNMNRVFPGDTNGTFSDVLAHLITEEFQMKSDFYIDLHCGDLNEMVTPFVYYPGAADENVVSSSRNAANVLNMKYKVKSSSTTGAYSSCASKGVASLLLERGGYGILNKENVKEYKNDVYSLLAYFDVINKKYINYNPLDIEKVTYVGSDLFGFWYPLVNAGDIIKKNQMLGVIKDSFTNTLKEIKADHDGVVLYMTLSLAINKDSVLIAYAYLP